MARVRLRLGVLVVLVAFAIGAALWFMQPGPVAVAPAFDPAADGHADALRPPDQQTVPAKVLPDGELSAAPQPAASQPDWMDDPDPDGPWEIRGRITFPALRAQKLDHLLSPGSSYVLLQWLDFSNSRAVLESYTHSTSEEGNFVSTWPRARLNPHQCGWFVSHAGQEKSTTPLAVAANAPERPRAADVPGLATPVIRGRFIDFGVIECNVGPESGWTVLTGRLMHTSGVSVMAQDGIRLSASREGELIAGSWGYTDAEGRFAFLVSSLDTREGDAWSVSIGELDKSFPCEAPRFQGNVGDFGDIVVNCAMLDVRMSFPGAPELPIQWRPGWAQYAETKPAPNVELRLTAPGEEIWHLLLVPPSPARFVVPEGRFRYEASVSRMDFVACALNGRVAVRNGERVELVLNFVPEKLLPVRVLDPDGNPVAAHVHWRLRQSEGEQALMEDSHEGLKHVPVRENWITEVTAYHGGYKAVQAKAAYGQSELTLQFADRIETARVEFILPPAPEGTDKPRRVLLVVEYLEAGDAEPPVPPRYRRASAYVTLRPDGPGMEVIELGADRSFRPGRAMAWLDSMLGGYRDWRMTEPILVELPQVGTTRIELPAPLPPPWGMLANAVNHRFTCDGLIVGVAADFEFADGQRRYSIFEPGIPIHDPSRPSGRQVGLIPLWLDATQGLPEEAALKYPIRFEEPSPEKPEALAWLDLPVRLRVRVTVHGKPANEFSAALTACRSARRSLAHVWCETKVGAANLWCPTDDATLTIDLPGRKSCWSGEVRLPASGSMTLEIAIDTFEVKFKRPEGAGSEVLSPWTITPENGHSALEEHAQWGKSMHLSAGRYTVQPLDWRLRQHAFELDVRQSCEVVLPRLEEIDVATVLLRIRAADWREFTELDFEFYSEEETEDPKQALVDGLPLLYGHTVVARVVPDGILLRGLPIGRKICLRGSVQWEGGENNPGWLLAPVTLTLKADNQADATWTRAVSLDAGWSRMTLGVTSDFIGHLLPFQYDGGIRPGTHTLAIHDGDKELLRYTVNVPVDAEEFKVPADLLQKVEEAEARNREPDE